MQLGEVISTELNDCSICLCELDNDDEEMPVVVLRCNHLFHQACIENWEKYDKSTRKGASCPLCRSVFKQRPSKGVLQRISGFFMEVFCLVPSDPPSTEEIE